MIYAAVFIAGFVTPIAIVFLSAHLEWLKNKKDEHRRANKREFKKMV